MKKLANNKKRALVLVLDGLGIGEMPDVKKTRKKDIGAYTLKSILKNQDPKKYPNFTKIGLSNIRSFGLPKTTKPLMNYGKSKLTHFGADTYWGHQEIVGTKPIMPVIQHTIDIADDLAKAFKAKGHKVRFYKNKAVIIIDKNVVIADNLEADPGWVISVTGSRDYISFKKILEIGKIARSVFKTSRVNVHGGKFIDLNGLLKHIKVAKDDQGKKFIGHDVSKTGIYPSPHFRQIQLGYGVNPNKQITSILTKNKIPVVFIGKAGDVITCQGAQYNPMAQTDGVIKLIYEKLSKQKNGLIMANVQETDLSGHAQDKKAYLKAFNQVEKSLLKIIKKLNKNDLFIITADHGNDPTIGHPNHTREYTPLLAMQKGNSKIGNLGTRKTLSDIGATLADFFAVPKPENGISFLHKIL